jgi:hypothetical protein
MVRDKESLDRQLQMKTLELDENENKLAASRHLLEETRVELGIASLDTEAV